MSAETRWVHSPFDEAYHARADSGPQWFGLNAAHCGVALFGAEQEHSRPLGRPCADCWAMVHDETDLPQARQDE